MSLRKPGFTQAENFKQNSINARAMLTNLLSAPNTVKFSVEESGGDLNVFRNNVNNTSTYEHKNKILQGDEYLIAAISPSGAAGPTIIPNYPSSGYGLLAGRVYFQLNKEGQSSGQRARFDNDFSFQFVGTDVEDFNSPSGGPVLKPTVFGFDDFYDANNQFDGTTLRNTIHHIDFFDFGSWIGVPGFFFQGYDSPVGPQKIPFPLVVGETKVRVFSNTAIDSVNHKQEFVNGELKISVPDTTEIFTDGDVITKVTASKGPITLGGSFKVDPAGGYLDSFSPSDSPSGTRGFGAFGGNYEYRPLTNRWQHVEDSPETTELFFSLNTDLKWEFNFSGGKVTAEDVTTYPWQANWGNFQAFTVSDNSPAVFDATNVILPDLDTEFEFDGVIKDTTFDYENNIKSFIVSGKTFSGSEQTTLTNAFDTTSVVLTRKNGVTQSNLLNTAEYSVELYADKSKTLLNIGKETTFKGIINDINTSISTAKNRITGHINRRSTKDIDTKRPVNIEGVVRFRDTKGVVDEDDNTINADAPGIFILQDDSPLTIKRAYSEVSEVWTINSTNNNIEIKSGKNILSAVVLGQLVFEDVINIDVDHLNNSPQIELYDSPLNSPPGVDANGTDATDFDEGLGVGVSPETFTHRMVIEVDELDVDGTQITTQYSILAVRNDDT